MAEINSIANLYKVAFIIIKMRNGVHLILFVIVIFAFFLASVSAANSCSDSSQVIFRLSGNTNAHAEVFNGQGNYDTEICYNQLFSDAPIPGNRECLGNNEVLRLSSDTNAHAETPYGNNYNVKVCYRDLRCGLRTSCRTGEVAVVRLSYTTNAHLEPADSRVFDSDSYSKILCCTSISAPGEGCVPSCIDGKICSDNVCVDPPASTCGNGAIDSGEGCDGSNFDGKTCGSLIPGSSGTLSCNSCVVDTSQCIGGINPQCADGIDNDNDGLIDFGNDPGCVDINDDDEIDFVPGEKRAYWANTNNNELADGATVEVGDSIHLVALGVPTNAKIVFTILDRDGLAEGIFDDEIATSPEVSESGNEAIYAWNIVPSDFEKGISGDSDRRLELYFIAQVVGYDETSPTLFLIEKEIGPGPVPVGCNAYNDQDYLDSLAGSPSIESACNNDLGRQLGSDPEYSPVDAGFRDKFGVGCNDKITKDSVTTETFCFCKLNTDGICFFDSNSKMSFPDDGSGNVCTGSCKNEPEYSECMDNLQTITIKGTIEDINNCNADQIEELELSCTEETSTDVSCGISRLLLPFFDKIHFLISVFIILAIYMCLGYQKVLDFCFGLLDAQDSSES